MTKVDEKKQTIEAYNKTAQKHAKKFEKLGARVKDIERALSYLNKPNPKVIEIGCGNGRDAKEIVKHTKNYLGIDLSKSLIQLAIKKAPEAKFQMADFETYQFPQNIDVIFAFASLIHSNKEGVKKVLRKAYKSLGLNGVFFISLNVSSLSFSKFVMI